jgi:hypothetical protein
MRDPYTADGSRSPAPRQLRFGVTFVADVGRRLTDHGKGSTRWEETAYSNTFLAAEG